VLICPLQLGGPPRGAGVAGEGPGAAVFAWGLHWLGIWGSDFPGGAVLPLGPGLVVVSTWSEGAGSFRRSPVGRGGLAYFFFSQILPGAMVLDKTALVAAAAVQTSSDAGDAARIRSHCALCARCERRRRCVPDMELRPMQAGFPETGARCVGLSCWAAHPSLQPARRR
jgi:hypothetical protein